MQPPLREQKGVATWYPSVYSRGGYALSEQTGVVVLNRTTTSTFFFNTTSIFPHNLGAN